MAFIGIGWRRWLAGGLMALGGLGALLDLGAPDDPLKEAEAAVRQANPGALDNLRAMPEYRQMKEESRWRAATRQTHRVRENARTIALSLGALVLAWGILRRKAWASPLLATGLAIWTGLYALDLVEARSFLGHLPSLFAWGQGLNLFFILGLWVWLRRDDRQPPARVVPSF